MLVLTPFQEFTRIITLIPKLFLEIEIRDKLILDLNQLLVKFMGKDSIIKNIKNIKDLGVDVNFIMRNIVKIYL